MEKSYVLYIIVLMFFLSFIINIIIFCKLWSKRMNNKIDSELKKILLELVYFKDGDSLKTSYNQIQISIKNLASKIFINLIHPDSGCYYQLTTEELKINDFSVVGDYDFIMNKLKANIDQNDETLTLHTTQLNEYTKHIKNSVL